MVDIVGRKAKACPDRRQTRAFRSQHRLKRARIGSPEERNFESDEGNPDDQNTAEPDMSIAHEVTCRTLSHSQAN